MRRDGTAVGRSIALRPVLASLASLAIAGCGSLWSAGEFPTPLPLDVGGPAVESAPAGQRVDIFRDGRGEPELPIANEPAAISVALSQPDLLAHLRKTDASYGGRRLEGLVWIASAQRDAADPNAPWNVELRARIRDSSAAYVCSVEVTPEGAAVVAQPVRKSCRWEPVN